jgi:hypothetical protein
MVTHLPETMTELDLELWQAGLELGDEDMGNHRPDGDMPTPPPGGWPPHADPDAGWKRGVWGALKDLKKDAEETQKQVTALLIATKGSVDGMALTAAVSSVRNTLFQELEKRDKEIQSLREFKVKITTAVILLNFLIGIALTVIAMVKK